MPTPLNVVFLALTDAVLALALASSLAEKERRASLAAAFALAANTALWAGFMVLPPGPMVKAGNIAAAVLAAAFGALSLWKQKQDKGARSEHGAIVPYDERDHMFSRNALKFHSETARRYYELHPDKREADEAVQRKAEIGEAGQAFYDPLYSPAFLAAFDCLDRSRPLAEGEAAEEKTSASPAEIREAVRRLALYFGAADVGFVKLRPHHLYSRRGRHADGWGEAVRLEHSTAVVLISAMELRMMRQAPSLPVILESSRQYVESAKTAFLLAGFLRRLGYQARAHTDANYLTVCIPVAADAGLGEVGRMGILIHPRLGPCLRISVVTTDGEFPSAEESGGRKEWGIDAFCRICRKCADACPAKAIHSGEKPESRGAAHWSIRQERCFSYWKSLGTDCGVCIRVCPFAKPDTPFHRLARRYVSRNAPNRRIALVLDELLYGRRPRLPRNNPNRLFPN